ncbi:MAG: pantetheine-phosphate adenylyltransferase [Clostridiales bacterium]|nr:pantetheine-phosphate adenylyltransferase [Clostridiales bacterium]
MKTCVFAGTFDPVTTGHEDMIIRCAKMYDKVVVAIGKNGEKLPFFTLEERVEILKSAFKDYKNVEIATFDGMLIDFMKERNIKINVRGLRNERDYTYETEMACYNQDYYPELITVYLPTPKNLTYVSSSAVRKIIAIGADVSEYIPSGAVKVVKEIIKSKKMGKQKP